MWNKTLLATGIVGSVIAALCCATPLLAILVGTLGLGAWIGGVDYVVLPALALFLVLIIYALIRNRATQHHPTPDAETKV